MSISRRALFVSTGCAVLRAAAPLKIVVTGGHPGDPECGCAGTIARYTALGHEVAIVYLNRGEGFCGDAPIERCAAIRTAEAREACRILKAKPIFAGQIDGHAIIDELHYEEFARLLTSEKPDVVFTQWPVDSHRDHRAVASLTLDAWLKGGKRPALYYYEVAEDSATFTPTEYVNVSMVEAQRHAACYAHASQRPDQWYPKQVEITRSRGATSGFAQAEAFCRHSDSRRAFLP